MLTPFIPVTYDIKMSALEMPFPSEIFVYAIDFSLVSKSYGKMPD